MAERNVVVVRFDEPSKAYQGLSVLKQCDAEGRIEIEGAAVVERSAAGGLVVSEKDDDVDYAGTVGGSVIGMLVGVLGGPVGVLLGLGTGALVGSAVDIDRAETSEEALTVLGRSIPPGSAAAVPSAPSPSSRSSAAPRSKGSSRDEVAEPHLRGAAPRPVHRLARPDDRLDRAADHRRRPRRPATPLVGRDGLPTSGRSG
jgi:uncharacterized membrane protein